MFANRITIYQKLFFVLLFGIATSFGVYAQDSTAAASTDDGGVAKPSDEVYAKGQTLWQQNCTSCHNLTAEKKVGPGMKGLFERRDRAWLKPWIVNSQAVIASGDDYANKLYNEYNQTVMTSFAFKDDELDALLDFIAYESEQEAVVVADGTETVAGEPQEGGVSSNYFNLLLGVLVFVLILILAVLFLMVTILNRFLNQKEDLDEADKEIVNQRFNPFSIFQSRAFLGGVALIFVLVVAKTGLDGLIGVGIQQGYAPTQPIAFSHKLHAGMYEIDCGYCHTGVYKGKSATIPSANICMNCHNQVKVGSPEIQKIYKAIENDKPIEWIRIHNLPDLAYFNHSQHTNVAGLECVNCHGEVEKMEVVAQRAPLTMGWCINCHRQSAVDHAEGNEYYDRLLEYHEETKGKAPMTVEQIGGLECSKCHY